MIDGCKTKLLIEGFRAFAALPKFDGCIGAVSACEQRGQRKINETRANAASSIPIIDAQAAKHKVIAAEIERRIDHAHADQGFLRCRYKKFMARAFLKGGLQKVSYGFGAIARKVADKKLYGDSLIVAVPVTLPRSVSNLVRGLL
jgi:hypothetical protein